MTHCLKTWPEYFKAIQSGEKPFEVRKDDRPFEIGDHMILQEYDIHKKEYSGKEYECRITYILRGPEFGIKKGYVVMGIKERELLS